MKFAALSHRGLGYTVVGVLGLAVGFSLCVSGRITSDSGQTSRRLQAGDDSAGSADVTECSGTAGTERRDVLLNARQGYALKFSCGQGMELAPPKKDSSKLDKVFKYTVEESVKTCNWKTDSAVVLADELEGATLREDIAEAGDNNSRTKKSPVYVFQYTTEPTQDKHLCYTCNKTAGSTSPGTQVTSSKPAEETVACTVFINVPKKKEETTTSSSTPAPGSPSGARAMPAAIATAVGGLLAVVLRT